MSEPPPWHAQMLRETASEVTFIVKGFASAPQGGDVPLIHRGADIGVEAAGDGVDYLYAKRHLLVADHYLDQVLEILGDPGTHWLEPGKGDGNGDGDGKADGGDGDAEGVLQRGQRDGDDGRIELAHEGADADRRHRVPVRARDVGARRDQPHAAPRDDGAVVRVKTPGGDPPK